MNTLRTSLIFTPGATAPETISDTFSYLYNDPNLTSSMTNPQSITLIDSNPKFNVCWLEEKELRIATVRILWTGSKFFDSKS